MRWPSWPRWRSCSGRCRSPCGPTGAAASWWRRSPCIIFAVFGPLMGLSPNVWAFVFLYLIASIGFGRQQHGAQLVPRRRLPDRGPGAGLQLAQPLRPALADHRDPASSASWSPGPQLALRTAGRRWPAFPSGSRLFTLREPDKGANESQPHPQGRRAWTSQTQQEEAPRVLLGLGHDQAAADPLALLRAGGRGHPRLRRHRRSALRQPLLHRQIPPGHGRAAARSTPSSAWPPSSACPWPTCSATASSAGPPSAHWSSPASASPPTAACSSASLYVPSCGCA